MFSKCISNNGLRADIRFEMKPQPRRQALAPRDDTDLEALKITEYMTTTSLACTLLTLAMLVSGAAAEDKSALLNFLVVRDYNGKPIRNASVVMHPVKKRRQANREAACSSRPILTAKPASRGSPMASCECKSWLQASRPLAMITIFDQTRRRITVKMKRPQGQYSIYEDHPTEKKDEKPQN